MGWIYSPISPVGWVITTMTLALCAWVVLAVDRSSHSVSDTLIGAFPYVALFIIVAVWIAANTSAE
jgi:hypothetical protein